MRKNKIAKFFRLRSLHREMLREKNRLQKQRKILEIKLSLADELISAAKIVNAEQSAQIGQQVKKIMLHQDILSRADDARRNLIQ